MIAPKAKYTQGLDCMQPRSRFFLSSLTRYSEVRLFMSLFGRWRALLQLVGMRANNRQSLLGPATDPFSGSGDPWAEADQFQGVSSSELQQQQQHVLQGNAHIFSRLDNIYALQKPCRHRILVTLVWFCVCRLFLLPNPSHLPPPTPSSSHSTCRMTVPRQCVWNCHCIESCVLYTV